MPDRYAVIGNPVAHSVSPAIHSAFARETRQDLVYERLLAPLDGFAAAVARFGQDGGRGLNVTLPFKHEAYALATRHSPRAAAAGAANTLKFEPGGALYADNTDGAGLVRDLQVNLGFTLRAGRVLLMGAGGASYGVLEPLARAAPAQLVVANRTPEKATALVGRFEATASFVRYGLLACAYGELAGRQFDLVINATSAGVDGEVPPLPPGLFAPGALAYDMFYGAGPTPFVRYAQAQGAARSADGYGMLVEQAAESFFVWRGVRPETRELIASRSLLVVKNV
ncbi:MAG: shikimate dehydrogenase [Burkholderiales bacterium]